MFWRRRNRPKLEFFDAKEAGGAFFESLPDAVVLCNVKGAVGAMNAAARELFGYEDCASADLMVDALAADSSDTKIGDQLRSLSRNEVSSVEIECRRAGGVMFPAELSMARTKVAGHVIVTIVVRNITHHRRAVHSLRESEQLTRAVLTSALDAIVCIDERGIVREFNPAAEQLFGYARDEALGSSMAELIIPQDKRDAHRSGMQRYLREGSSRILGRRLEMEAMKRDGSVFPVEVRVSEVNRGPARMFTAYLSDISERVEALAAIAEERNKLEAILSATSDGILLVDRHGFVRYANKSFEELFGLSTSVVERVHVREVHAHLQQLAPLPVDVFERVLTPSGNGCGSERMSDRCSISSPVERSLMVARKPVGSDLAGEGSWLAVFRDNSRDEEIRRAKDDLVGNVSHELRTPLTAIRGFVQLLRDDRIGEITEQQDQFLDVIADNVERLMQLVSDLLDVDRVDNVPLRADDVVACEIVREAVASEIARAEAKGLHLSVDISDGLMLVGDRDRLIQVFQHLLSNAVRYTTEGGVSVVGRPVDQGMAEFEVRDTGVGMTATEQEHAFDRFFRSAGEFVREAAGTGLGLSIVHTLVERHGGTIEVESSLGVGSCFRITLPRDPEAVAAAIAVSITEESPAPLEAVPGNVAAGASPVVLLVEDNGPVRNVLAQGMELEGLTVVSASTGQEALRLARQHLPDVVLLDLTLPDIDGWVVLEALRSDDRFERTRVLVVSGHDEPDKAARCGADGFIAKPVDVLALSEEIHRMTEPLTTGRQPAELV